MRTVNICQGVNLRLIEGEKFEYVTMAVLFRQPLSRKYATANSLLSLMFLSGSSKYKDRRMIEIRLEELEGAILDTSIIKKGSEHIIELYARFKPCYTDEIISLISDVTFKPLFKNENVEKNILKNIIDGQINNKRQYAFNSFMEKLYDDVNGDGYTADIPSVNVEQHYKYVMENSLIDIMAIGGDSSLITQCIKNHMHFTPRKKFSIPLNKIKPVKERYIEEADVIQGKLCVGIDCSFNCTGEDYARLLVANDIFGSGASSRLFMEAREKENLCYYISSRLFRFSQLMSVEAGIDSINMDKTVNIIDNALRTMKTTSPKPEEIELAKSSIINNYRASLDKPDALLNIYLNQIMAEDNRSIEDIISCMEGVNSIEGVFDGFNISTVYMLGGSV